MIKRIRMIVAPILLILSVLMVLFSDTLIHTINVNFHYDEVITHIATVDELKSYTTSTLLDDEVKYTKVKVTLEDSKKSVEYILKYPIHYAKSDYRVGSKIQVYEFHDRYNSIFSEVLNPPEDAKYLWCIAAFIFLLVTLYDLGLTRLTPQKK